MSWANDLLKNQPPSIKKNPSRIFFQPDPFPKPKLAQGESEAAHRAGLDISFWQRHRFDQLEAIVKLQPELPLTHTEKGNFLACVFQHFWNKCYIWHGK